MCLAVTINQAISIINMTSWAREGREGARLAVQRHDAGNTSPRRNRLQPRKNTSAIERKTHGQV